MTISRRWGIPAVLLVFSQTLLAQFSQQGSKLVGNGASGGINQGTAVAVSADGSTALVGAFSESGGRGAAWVFVQSGGTWVQQAQLVGTGAVGNAHQGYSVALSSDGSTALVGGYTDATSVGAAWVFTRSGVVWTQQSKLVGTGYSGNPQQGFSVSLSADGSTAMLGGPSDGGTVGAVWMFKRTGSSWAQQGGKLAGTGTIGNAQQGSSVAISGDGLTAIEGGYGDNTGAGAAWVFVWNGASWLQQGKLVGTGAIGKANQGHSVGIASDGNTVILGAPSDNGLAGAAWIFGRSGTTWSETGKYVGSGISGNDYQGWAVAMSGDGSTAMVGGYNDNFATGATWVFVKSGGVFTQQGSKLVGTGGLVANQGISVSLSSNGNTALVGGYADDHGTGATWGFTRSGTTWSQSGAKLVGTGAVGSAQQGTAVALSSNGSTAIVGGPQDGSNIGATWVFTRAAGVWSPQGSKLVGTGVVTAAFQASSVALSADGNTAVMGGPTDNTSVGATWVFGRGGTTWTQQGSKLVGTGASGPAHQGEGVAISADGSTLVAGGPNDASNAGAAWVFTQTAPGVWTQQGSKLVGTGASGAAQQGMAVALSADGNTALVGGYADNGLTGATWVFVRSGTTWSQQGTKLVGSGASGNSGQGYAVALSGDGNTALVGAPWTGSSAGAVWVFRRSGTIWSQQAGPLVGSGAIGAAFQGYSVSLSTDGNTGMVGGYSDNANIGAAWIFTRSGTVWSEPVVHKLVGTGSAGSNPYQGTSVALSGDGNTAISGARNDLGGVGAAWVFATPSAPVSLSRFSAE